MYVEQILNELISIEMALRASSELDDNEGLAPPEVHVKNRAFFALGVHVLELQATLKVCCCRGPEYWMSRMSQPGVPFSPL